MMNRLFLSIALLSTALVYCDAFDDNFDDFVDDMQQEFQDRFDRLEKRVAQQRRAPAKKIEAAVTSTLQELPDRSGIEISVVGLDLPETGFEADYDEDDHSLTIGTTAGVITIHANGRYVSVSFKKEASQERKDEGYISSSVKAFAREVARNVSKQVSLELAVINYDKRSKTMTITIPYRKRVPKKIAVNISETTENEK